jgi:hypothetical protein
VRMILREHTDIRAGLVKMWQLVNGSLVRGILGTLSGPGECRCGTIYTGVLKMAMSK